MSTKHTYIALTQEAFESLPEYSHSLPTGTTIGKQWKRKVSKTQWDLVEYTKHQDPALVGISYRRIVIREAGLRPENLVQMKHWHEGLASGVLVPRVPIGFVKELKTNP